MLSSFRAHNSRVQTSPSCQIYDLKFPRYCLGILYFCLPLHIEARATQEMHFSPIYRHCDSALTTIRDRLHLLQKYHFRKQTLLSNRGEGARTVEIHPPSTCLFWRARWVQSSASQGPLPIPLPSTALREGGNGCALGNFPKRTQFGHLACSVSPFFSLRRGEEVGRGGIATLPCNDDLGGVMSNGK